MHRIPHIEPSRLFRVNSRFKKLGERNSNFTYNYDNRLVDGCYKVALISASIPRLYTNIFDANNVLLYVSSLTGEVRQFVVPTGQYTALELAAALDLCPDLTVTYDEGLHRFIAFAPYPLQLTLLAASSIGHYIGLTADLELDGASTLIFPSPPSLAGCQTLYLQSQFLACANTVDTPVVSPFIPLIVPIAANAVPYGFTIAYTATDIEIARVSWGGKVSLRQIDIQITDQYGNPLNLPDNAYVDLVFRMYYDD